MLGVTEKVLILAFTANILNLVRMNITRYFIRTYISSEEISFGNWFSLDFLRSLGPTQYLALLIIASFTLITFPLGIWIGSFKLGFSISLSAMINITVEAISNPIQAVLVNKGLRELTVSTTTIIGYIVVTSALLIAVFGWYLVSIGQSGTV